MHVSQFKKNPKTCLYFCDKRFFVFPRGVLLKAIVEVLEDAESKEMIWKKGDTMYYSKGVADPDYCVLRFTIQSGRFYSNFKSEDFNI